MCEFYKLELYGDIEKNFTFSWIRHKMIMLSEVNMPSNTKPFGFQVLQLMEKWWREEVVIGKSGYVMGKN